MTIRAISGHDGAVRRGLTGEQVWQAVVRASFAVLSGGIPRPREAAGLGLRHRDHSGGRVPHYGLGVSLRTMLDPAASQARVPMAGDAGTR